jgi:hypothetical protein
MFERRRSIGEVAVQINALFAFVSSSALSAFPVVLVLFIFFSFLQWLL